MGIKDVIEKLRDSIIDEGLTYEDMAAELTLNVNGSAHDITIEFESDDFDAVQVYGSGCEEALPEEFDDYLDDEDLYRDIPVDDFTDKLDGRTDINLINYSIDEM